MRIIFFSLLFLLLSETLSNAQSSDFSGNIVDEITGDPVAGAHIFVPSTSYQAYTDSSGNFIMPEMPLGFWQIKFFHPNFHSSTADIIIEKSQTNQNYQLRPLTDFAPIPQELSKKKREKYTELFIKVFLGLKDNDSPVLLVNPEVLLFEETGKKVKVSASEAIFFRNLESGYLVTSYFEPFHLNESKVSLKADYTYFEIEQLTSQAKQATRSTQMALFENSIENQMVRLLSGETANFNPEPQPKVYYGDNPGEYKLIFTNPTQLTLPNSKKVTFSYSGEYVSVKSNGALVHPEELQISGEIEEKSPVLLLPSNFEGEKIIRLKNLERTAEGMQERIYLHTDRGYYWQNEPIFFKAYIRYGDVAFADELSKVLHVELLDDAGKLISHRVFRIENGLSQGVLEPKDMLNQGNYVLKAYTAWSTNYGEDGVFFQPLQIIGLENFPPSRTLKDISQGVSFFSDKQNYGPNEEVGINIMVRDDKGNPINANLSVAVLDLNQTQPSSEPQGIMEALELKKPDLSSKNFLIDSEFGFSLIGKIYDQDGKPIRGSAELLLNGLEDRVQTATGSDDGAFMLSDRQFEGSFEIAMKATPRDGNVRSSKSLEIKRFGEEIKIPEFEYPKTILAENTFLSKQEIISGMQGGEVLMEEAVIESTRERKEGPVPYGTPDNIVDPSELQLNGDSQQFLFLLASKIPGMQVGGTPTAVKFRGGEPLVMINGIPAALAGTPVIDVLARINVFAIDRVEVIRRLVPTLGDQGRNGVISIFTKTGKEYEEAIMANMNSFQSFSIEGFPKKEWLLEKIKKATDTNQTQRPVLYWNPNLISTENTLSQKILFTTGNQAGPIWLEIKGITNFGEPVYGHFVLNVK